jgi:hypothetical protein
VCRSVIVRVGGDLQNALLLPQAAWLIKHVINGMLFDMHCSNFASRRGGLVLRGHYSVFKHALEHALTLIALYACRALL